MIRFKEYSCGYDAHLLVENLNLESASFTILGANGVGKSSFGKSLVGLVESRGKFYVDGVDVENLDSKERAKLIAYIPASLEFYESYMSVGEFCLISRFAYKQSFKDYTQKDRDRVDEVLAKLSLLDIKDRALHLLSSGQKQLVLIASALMSEAKVMIFDEPNANLDPKHSKEFMKLLTTLSQRSYIILITQDINFAFAFNKDVLFLQEGDHQFYRGDFFTKENLFKNFNTDFEIGKRSLAQIYE